MPLYEYRCKSCHAITTALKPAVESQASVECERCGAGAHRILSRPSVHRSKASKADRLDPRYDKMVDKAMADTQHAEPDRYLKKMKPLSEG